MAANTTTQHSTDITRVLDPNTAMDAVTLYVGDLELMSSYYEDALALEPVEEHAHGHQVHRVLGRGTTPMIRLISTPDLPGVDPREVGLFHTAFLFDDRQSLAATVHRAAQNSRSRFVGSSDHLVSEAFYSTFGFTPEAGRDDTSGLWATSFAVTRLSEEAERRIVSLLERAVA